MDQTVQAIVDEITNYIHGPARDHIISTFTNEQGDIAETIAAMSYRIVRESIDKVEGQGPVDIDIVLGVATETIDLLLEILDALGVKYDPEEMREDTLLRMTALHMEQVGNDPEQKAIAQAALEEMMVDGSYQEAMGAAEGMMRKHGVDPSQAAQAGEQMAMGPRDELSQGVSRGLMGG